MATLAYQEFVGITNSNTFELPYDTATVVLQITDTASGTTVDLKLQGSITLEGEMVDLIPEGADSEDLASEGVYRYDGRGLRAVRTYGDTTDLKVEAVAAS